MALTQQAGRAWAARPAHEAGLKVRQPLREMRGARSAQRRRGQALRRMEDQVLEELNVKRLVLTSRVGELISYVIKPNLPCWAQVGKRLGAIRDALAAARPGAIAAARSRPSSP